MTPDRSKSQRRRPRQARARASFDAIVEAAAQILERDGVEALNTNDIAERAGVSIGTLYQYFPDKQAILSAVARRELAEAPALAARQRALVQALIDMIERLGGLAVRPSRPAAPRRIRRNLSGDFKRLLVDLLIPAKPALIPIRIDERRRRRR
jgi:AcrR family transcriptional regulator